MILPFAIITITLALIFYTIGVWSEHKNKTLLKKHVIFFWLGLIMDTTGTSLMGRIAGYSLLSGHITLHGVTGALAILLMIIHAVWATVVIVKKSESQMASFHKFSLLVWGIWLIPYILGMIIGMK